MAANTFEDYLQQVRDSMSLMHPNVSRYPEIATMLANELAYQMWRKARVYDHCEIMFGARMPDGTAGYTISFAEQREGGRVVSLQVTGTELAELVEKGRKALGQED